VPVLADARCAVLSGHLARCGGGQTIASYEAFAAALHDLWQDPQRWRALGHRGREYVRARYGSRAAFTDRLVASLLELRQPLAERLRRHGRERALAFSRSAWRERFGRLVEELLHAPPLPVREEVEVQPLTSFRTVAVGQPSLRVPVRIHNRGTQPLIADGPARQLLRVWVVSEAGEPLLFDTPLPALVLPGTTIPAAALVPVPATPGTYQVSFQVVRAAGAAPRQEPFGASPGLPVPGPRKEATAWQLRLLVEAGAGGAAEGWCTPLLEGVRAALAEAGRWQQLPDDYVDVTEGFFASCKRWLKRKLLGNFKRAYVDVLSRQQSAFNSRVVTALTALAECAALLEHAGRHQSSAEPDRQAWAGLCRELSETRARLAQLEEQLKQREAPDRAKEVCS